MIIMLHFSYFSIKNICLTEVLLINTHDYVFEENWRKLSQSYHQIPKHILCYSLISP